MICSLRTSRGEKPSAMSRNVQEQAGYGCLQQADSLLPQARQTCRDCARQAPGCCEPNWEPTVAGTTPDRATPGDYRRRSWPYPATLNDWEHPGGNAF
jgi:hypothetical protein